MALEERNRKILKSFYGYNDCITATLNVDKMLFISLLLNGISSSIIYHARLHIFPQTTMDTPVNLGRIW